MTTRRRKVEVGSDNISADLGLPDADDMLLKSTVVIELHRLIKQRKLTQSAAAKLIGISQGDLSKSFAAISGDIPRPSLCTC